MSKIYTFNELKESKLIYDRKPPAFGVIMTLFSLIFVAVAITWAVLSPKTYVVKATGIVCDSQKINVMNTVSGRVKIVAVKEGQVVSSGDLLIELDSYQTELQIAQIESVSALYDKRIAANRELIDIINNYKLSDETTHKNPFDKDDNAIVLVYYNAEMVLNYMQNQAANGSTQEEIDDFKPQLISQLSLHSAIEQCVNEKVQQESQLKTYRDSLSEYSVRARQNGVVHLSEGITPGTVLTSSVIICTISSGNAEELYFNTVIGATERSKLSTGNAVEVSVSGVSQTEYGTLKGEIVSIDEDSTQTEDGQVFYRVKIEPTDMVLTDKYGNEIRIMNGMLGECRIKYDETTWFNWIIEQIVGKIK
ncbi:MAG: biotin/lipoyl-binding protein [Clostridia bacterium]|nr:biotin/lipoyl-binding protein [Clostridia bacterium]